MAVLSEARALVGEARRALDEGRSRGEAWSDAQRSQLDRSVLDPVTADAQRLAAAMERAADEIDQARAQLVRPY